MASALLLLQVRHKGENIPGFGGLLSRLRGRFDQPMTRSGEQQERVFNPHSTAYTRGDWGESPRAPTTRGTRAAKFKSGSTRRRDSVVAVTVDDLRNKNRVRLVLREQITKPAGTG